MKRLIAFLCVFGIVCNSVSAAPRKAAPKRRPCDPLTGDAVDEKAKALNKLKNRSNGPSYSTTIQLLQSRGFSPLETTPTGFHQQKRQQSPAMSSVLNPAALRHVIATPLIPPAATLTSMLWQIPDTPFPTTSG